MKHLNKVNVPSCVGADSSHTAIIKNKTNWKSILGFSNIDGENNWNQGQKDAAVENKDGVFIRKALSLNLHYRRNALH